MQGDDITRRRRLTRRVQELRDLAHDVEFAALPLPEAVSRWRTVKPSRRPVILTGPHT